MYYSNTFFIFSVLGFIIEKIFNINRDSGILYGFWTPIYGIGVCITIFIYNTVQKKYDFKKIKKFIISFLIGFFALSILELIGGLLIERLFKITFWDYSDEKYSIFRYTSLKMAFIWGVSSVITIYIIKPIIDKFIKKIPRPITYILITAFSIDCIITIIPFITK